MAYSALATWPHYFHTKKIIDLVDSFQTEEILVTREENFKENVLMTYNL